MAYLATVLRRAWGWWRDHRPWWLATIYEPSAYWGAGKATVGWTLNLAGFPGFIRPCKYESGLFGETIKVRLSSRYTIINVNGLDIYFERISGRIDGVGGHPTTGCISDYSAESAHPPASLVPGRIEPQS